MARDEPVKGNGRGSGRPGLAPYACDPGESRGRLKPESIGAGRSEYQRDRDRIIHSTAFRRLNHKTQVFIYHEGDHYRSRLTHSIEVAQIARTIARHLSLDEDLAEAIALAHDLGHPPFGHAGEKALDSVMEDYGGFDHNAQSLRVVTELERKYADFDGLNLTWETLEGLAKHNGPVLGAGAEAIGPYAESGLPVVMADFNDRFDLQLDSFPGAEAQVAALADDIAYNNHDIDDGFRAGAYVFDELKKVPLTGEIIDQISESNPQLEDARLIYEINRRLITQMIDDVVSQSRQRLETLAPGTADDVRKAGGPVVSFTSQMNSACDDLRFFLLSWVYRNEKVLAVMDNAGAIVRELFAHYMDKPQTMPEDWAHRAGKGDEMGRARQICDFIAGMTDRYAVGEHRRLFDHTPELR